MFIIQVLDNLETFHKITIKHTLNYDIKVDKCINYSLKMF